MQGGDVSLLQKNLAELEFEISAEEIKKEFFEASMSEALIKFHQICDLLYNALALEEGDRNSSNNKYDIGGNQKFE